MWKDKKILFKLSGSIACFKACDLISQLVKQGADVQTVATTSALKFVGEATLEGITGKRVLTDTFAAGEAHQHIYAQRWADLTLLCPASAARINKFAHGSASDLLGTLFLAHDFKTPYVVIPAMNTTMYLHPATQKSLGMLAEYGVTIFPTNEGELACGEYGPGRMLEVSDILTKLEEVL